MSGTLKKKLPPPPVIHRTSSDKCPLEGCFGWVNISFDQSRLRPISCQVGRNKSDRTKKIQRKTSY